MPNSDALSVALREYIEQQIEHERQLRVAAFLARDENLRLQAQEYHRRLGELNGHLQQTSEDRAKFFTKESHEAFAVEFRRFRDEVKTFQTMVATWGAAAIFGLALLQAFMHFYLK
jgi:hypothetical protein